MADSYRSGGVGGCGGALRAAGADPNRGGDGPAHGDARDDNPDCDPYLDECPHTDGDSIPFAHGDPDAAPYHHAYGDANTAAILSPRA